jgi:hypothetical protein
MLSNEWKGEVEKQKSMSKRAREILLGWGCFSEDYVERAELLCDSGVKNRRSWMLLSVLIGVIVPMIAVLPFMFALEEDGEDPSRDGLIVSSVWLGCIAGYVKICLVCDLIVLFVHSHCLFLSYYSTVAVLLLHTMNLAFAKSQSKDIRYVLVWLCLLIVC